MRWDEMGWDEIVLAYRGCGGSALDVVAAVVLADHRLHAFLEVHQRAQAAQHLPCKEGRAAGEVVGGGDGEGMDSL